MLVDINKKCSICKLFMSLEKDDVVWDKSYMHFNCFVEKLSTKRGNKLSLEQIQNQVRKIQKENESHIKDTILRERFYRWLQNSYNVVVIPTYFFVKIDSVITGEYKGLTIPIPLTDLFDMWQRKKNELDKIAMNNLAKGKGIDSITRLNYDLAILVNKYDSYLNWKNKQKQIAEEIKIEEKPKIDFVKINKSVAEQKNDSTNINDILDELF